METTVLKQKSKEEVLDFIRERLSFSKEIQNQLRHVDEDEFKKEHRRFDMSGYESTTGKSTVFNSAILNEFADLGIYNYTSYLFLDFYKGIPTLYLKYFFEDENLAFDFSAFSTCDIIYAIFELTIFSDKRERIRG